MSESDRFGYWSIDQKVFGWILSNIQVGSHILELGSGWATGELGRYYEMHSIENQLHWLNRYKSHYIYAPSKNGWYDMAVLDQELSKIKYSLLLIDGPQDNERWKVFENARVFNWGVPVIVDDYQESGIKALADKISSELCQRQGQIIYGEKKMAMVIP